MAKKKEGRLDDLRVKDDLDFDNEDFDIDGLLEQPKDDRSPVKKVFSGTIEGAKSSAFSFDTWNEKVIKKVLPDDYGEALSQADNYTSVLSDLYDESSRTLRPTAYRLSRTIEKLVPGEKNIIKRSFKNIADKLAPESTYSQATPETNREELLRAALSELGGHESKEKTEDQIEEKARSDVKERLKEEIDHRYRTDQRLLTGSMEKNISLLTQYTTKNNANFQRKSLEIQYRSYFVQSDLLEITRKYFEVFKTQGESVVKNTGLPDYAKITDFELTADQGKRRLINEISQGIYGEGSPIYRAAKRLHQKGRRALFSARDKFNSALTGAEMMQMAKESGQDEFEMTGGIAGGVALDTLAENLGSWLNKKNPLNYLDKKFSASRPGTKIKNFLSRTNEVMQNPSGFFYEKLNSEKFEEDYTDNVFKDFFKRSARGLFEAFIDPAKTNIETNTDLNSLYKPSVFDTLTRKSIVSVIPTYLSHILREIKSQRTGKEEELSIFDYEKNSLISRGELKKNIKNKFEESLGVRSARGYVRGSFENIFAEDENGKKKFKDELKLTEDEMKALTEAAGILIQSGRFSGLDSLVKGEGKKILLRTLKLYNVEKGKSGYEIFKKLGRLFGTHTNFGYNNFSNDNALANRKSVNRALLGGFNSARLPSQLVQLLTETGNVESLLSSGLIKQNKRGGIYADQASIAKLMAGGMELYQDDADVNGDVADEATSTSTRQRRSRAQGSAQISSRALSKPLNSLVEIISSFKTETSVSLNTLIDLAKQKTEVKSTEEKKDYTKKIYEFLKKCGCWNKEATETSDVVTETPHELSVTGHPLSPSGQQAEYPRKRRRSGTPLGSMGFAGSNLNESKLSLGKLLNLISNISDLVGLGSTLMENSGTIADIAGLGSSALLPFDMMGIPIASVLGLGSTLFRMSQKSGRKSFFGKGIDKLTGLFSSANYESAKTTIQGTTDKLSEQFKEKTTTLIGDVRETDIAKKAIKTIEETKKKVLNQKYVSVALSSGSPKEAIQKLVDEIDSDLSESERVRYTEEVISLFNTIRKEKGQKEANKYIYELLRDSTKLSIRKKLDKVSELYKKHAGNAELRKETLSSLKDKTHTHLTTLGSNVRSASQKGINLINDKIIDKKAKPMIDFLVETIWKHKPKEEIESLKTMYYNQYKLQAKSIGNEESYFKTVKELHSYYSDQHNDYSVHAVIDKLEKQIGNYFKSKTTSEKDKNIRFNDRDGDGDRDGSWKDRLQNWKALRKTGSAKETDKQDTKGKGLLGGLFGMLGSLTKGIWNLGKMIPGIGSAIGALSLVLKPLKYLVKIPGLVGKMAGGAWKLGGMLRKSGIGRTAGSLAGGVLRAGVGIAARGLLLGGGVGLAVGAAAYGAYKGYQWWKHRRVKRELDKARFIQYGIRGENDEYNLSRINYLEEEMLAKGVVRLDAHGKVTFNINAIDKEEIISVFDIDMEDREAVERLNNYLTYRFLPIYRRHLEVIYGFNQKAKDFDALDDLKKEDVVRYLEATKYISGVIEADISPFKGTEKLTVSRKEVEDVFDKLITTYKKEARKTDPEGTGLLKSDYQKLLDAKNKKDKEALEQQKSEYNKTSFEIQNRINKRRRENQALIQEALATRGIQTQNLPIIQDQNSYSPMSILRIGQNNQNTSTNNTSLKTNIQSDEANTSGLTKNSSGRFTNPTQREKYLEQYAYTHGITDKTELAMFMAQMAHESFGFRKMLEAGSGEKYENRKDLGNIKKGDGERYKGRGFTGLTGRYNYELYGKEIGVDLVNSPERAEEEEIAAAIALAYWRKNNLDSPARDGNILAVTKAINGKFNGFEDRVQRFKEYLAKYEKEGIRVSGASDNYTLDTDTKGLIGIVKADKSADLSGVNANFMKNFSAMARDFNEQTGKSILVTEGKRTYERQAELFKKFGNNPKRAARPGTSLHEIGLAIDAGSNELNQAHAMGLMDKYALSRPITNEPWHVEPKGVRDNLAQIRNNPKLANELIEPIADSQRDTQNPNDKIAGLKEDKSTTLPVNSQRGEVSNDMVAESREAERKQQIKALRGVNQRIFSGETSHSLTTSQLTSFSGMSDDVKSIVEILNKSYEVQLKQLHALEKMASIHYKNNAIINETPVTETKRVKIVNKEPVPEPIVPVSRNF